MIKKRIMCFGDSNTWGSVPGGNGMRFGDEERWTGVVSKLIGDTYTIITEGLGGRTTVWDDPIEEYKNGSKHLIPALNSQKPLTLVILMLGTNDLKNRFSVSALDIANSNGRLIRMIRNNQGQNLKILLLAPPSIQDNGIYEDMFTGGYEKSLGFSKAFKNVAEAEGVEFLDLGDYIETSLIDGIHFDLKSHQIVGEIIAKKIEEIL